MKVEAENLLAPATIPAPLIALNKVVHSYGGDPVIRGLSFSLAPGQIGCLLGPSGCGKSTVLRAIAGFEAIHDGEIRIENRIVSSPRSHVPPQQRGVGMVFQDYALFPHLNVADNIRFGLHRESRNERETRVAAMLELVGLEAVAKYYPHELSGGQQQRVALARALAPRPRLLLLDEPFSNLDVDLRQRLSAEVRDILKMQGMTAIVVTHDQHEAFAMADEIGVMKNGSIQQWDSAYNLYHTPANRFVADFVGEGVFLPGTILNPRQVETEIGILDGHAPPGTSRGSRVDVLLRPDDISHDDESPLLGQVAKKAFRGADILYTLRLENGGTVLSLVPSHHNHSIGERIGIRLTIDHVISFPRE